MDLRDIGLGGVDWIPLAQDRDRCWVVMSAVMNLRVLAPRSWLVSGVPLSPLYVDAYRLFLFILILSKIKI
jgi:hypothetical protein